MAYEQEERTAEALVMPDKTDGLGPTPQGFPVILGDGRAYWFACASDPYGDDDPMVPLVEAAEEADKAAREYQESKISMRDYLKAMSKMCFVCLCLQYSDDLVDDVIQGHLITSRHYDEIVSAVLGTGPGYEVVVKKK